MTRSMSWRAAAGALAGALLATAAGGCAHDPSAQDPHANPARHHGAIPLALRGENTVLRLDFPAGKQTINPGQFQHDEICYLNAGDFRIDCFPDGSSLNLGPTDSTDLLTDVPGWALEPADDQDVQGSQFLHLSALLSLIAGSVDRLPAALSDYIKNPGPHLSQAMDLTEKLLNDPRIELNGYARGGNFHVVVELSDAGREKLEAALDEVGETPGELQWVGLSASPARTRPIDKVRLRTFFPVR